MANKEQIVHFMEDVLPNEEAKDASNRLNSMIINLKNGPSGNN